MFAGLTGESTLTVSGSDRQGASPPARAFATLPYITLLGGAGLVLTVVFGFEDPDLRWLAGSGALLAVAPLGLLLHLAFTGDLSRRDKRLWLESFAGMKDPRLFPEYFTSRSRSLATRRLRTRAREAGR